MKVFYCTDHAGHFPVPKASIVVASDEAEARGFLEAALDARGLSSQPFTLTELNPAIPGVYVLSDGDY